MAVAVSITVTVSMIAVLVRVAADVIGTQGIDVLSTGCVDFDLRVLTGPTLRCDIRVVLKHPSVVWSGTTAACRSRVSDENSICIDDRAGIGQTASTRAKALE